MVFVIKSKKSVKKANDVEFYDNIQGFAGDEIVYQLKVSNEGDINATDIEIVDILPYIGDTGVLLVDRQRESQYAIYATGIVSATLSDLDGNIINNNIDIIVNYSESNDPIRKDLYNEPIGTGVWLDNPPSDITKTRSIQVKTVPGFIFEPNQVITVLINAKIPVGVESGKTAYNSFAQYSKSLRYPDNPTQILPAEGTKVGVEVTSSTAGRIQGFTWFDTNKNGIYDNEETGINGITVEIYTENDEKLGSTVTTNDMNMDPGYYSFDNLADGVYKIKFVPSADLELTKQDLINKNGSKPDPTTGFTETLNIGKTIAYLNIDAGVIITCYKPTINAADKCIDVGTEFDPLEGVTAYDCDGIDITAKVQIIYNDVDTSTAGIYKVTYYVEDSKGQNSELSIIVKVCEITERFQAITDIIQSVALEQAALSHILNAEGEKIQKAVSLNISFEEIIEINKSVNFMVKSISKLELILQSKLGLFHDCIDCNNCCNSALDTIKK